MLDELSLDELKTLASMLKVNYHPNSKEDSLIKKIEAQQPHVVRDTIAKMKAKAEKQSVVHSQEPNDIIAAVRQYIDKGLEVTFNDIDDTWTFKCRGAEECGTIHQEMRRIIRCAENVSRGARVPRAIARSVGDPSYTGNVLSA